MIKIIICILIPILVTGCMQTNSGASHQSGMDKDQNNRDRDDRNYLELIVYKTKSDYYNLVPVSLSEDKLRIVSYPHPSDIIVDGNFSLPVRLTEGYLIDNRGINRNTAFLNMTYKEYANLNQLPSTIAMYDMIIDNNPFLELCSCGNRYLFTNIEEQLNQLILNDSLLIKCKSLK